MVEPRAKKPRRTITVAEKIQMVEEYNSGATATEVCAKYLLSNHQFRGYRKNYEAGLYTVDNSIAIKRDTSVKSRKFGLVTRWYDTLQEAQAAGDELGIKDIHEATVHRIIRKQQKVMDVWE